MPTASDEKRIADFMASNLSTFGLDHSHTAFAFVAHYGSAAQHAMFDFILSFMNKYASMYINGEVVPGNKMFQQCSMAYHMLASVSMAPPAPLPSGEYPEFGVDKIQGITLE